MCLRWPHRCCIHNCVHHDQRPAQFSVGIAMMTGRGDEHDGEHYSNGWVPSLPLILHQRVLWSSHSGSRRCRCGWGGGGGGSANCASRLWCMHRRHTLWRSSSTSSSCMVHMTPRAMHYRRPIRALWWRQWLLRALRCRPLTPSFRALMRCTKNDMPPLAQLDLGPPCLVPTPGYASPQGFSI
jgi:hypothetical protein